MFWWPSFYFGISFAFQLNTHYQRRLLGRPSVCTYLNEHDQQLSRLIFWTLRNSGRNKQLKFEFGDRFWLTVQKIIVNLWGVELWNEINFHYWSWIEMWHGNHWHWHSNRYWNWLLMFRLNIQIETQIPNVRKDTNSVGHLVECWTSNFNIQSLRILYGIELKACLASCS